MNKKQKKMLIRIVIAAVLVVAFSLIPMKGYVKFVLFMIPYLVIGYDILKKAGKGILNRQMFDENFLMAVATIGAILLGDYKEGVAVMLFYQIGELFQSYAVGKSRRNISELMDIRPDYANIEQDGKLEQVDPDEVEIGSVIVVQPGEKVPIDGIVAEGTSTLNTSALTGESVPQTVLRSFQFLVCLQKSECFLYRFRVLAYFLSYFIFYGIINPLKDDLRVLIDTVKQQLQINQLHFCPVRLLPHFLLDQLPEVVTW